MMTGQNSGPCGLNALPAGVPVFPGTVNAQGETLRIGEAIENGFDPSATGLDRPVGSIVSARNGAAAWLKTGTATTAWSPAGAAPAGSVTNAMLAPMVARTLKGNATAGVASPTDLTRDQVSILVDAFLRAGLVTRGQGLIAETIPRNLANNSTTVATSTAAIYIAVPLLAGDLISNLSVIIGQAGVAVTASKLGLYDSAGNLLAITADQGVAWESTGLKTAPVLVPFTVLTSGMYYVAEFHVAGTSPGFVRGVSWTSAAAALFLVPVGGGLRPAGVQTGLADLPAVANVAGGGDDVVMIWVGLS